MKHHYILCIAALAAIPMAAAAQQSQQPQSSLPLNQTSVKGAPISPVTQPGPALPQAVSPKLGSNQATEQEGVVAPLSDQQRPMADPAHPNRIVGEAPAPISTNGHPRPPILSSLGNPPEVVANATLLDTNGKPTGAVRTIHPAADGKAGQVDFMMNANGAIISIDASQLHYDAQANTLQR